MSVVEQEATRHPLDLQEDNLLRGGLQAGALIAPHKRVKHDPKAYPARDQDLQKEISDPGDHVSPAGSQGQDHLHRESRVQQATEQLPHLREDFGYNKGHCNG